MQFDERPFSDHDLLAYSMNCAYRGGFEESSTRADVFQRRSDLKHIPGRPKVAANDSRVD
jgi:hypothetical protein